MAFSWPEFTALVPVDDARSFTAKFRSYDQRNDECYYVISLFEGQNQVGQFMAQVGLFWAGDDWTGLGFVERLQSELREVAATGRANTDYQ
jgi:hypothetical protein